jgi:hypothetical protein
MVLLMLAGIWGGPAGVTPPVTFKAYWMTTVNQQIGPTPQEPAPR